jgi:hypothetical protein
MSFSYPGKPSYRLFQRGVVTLLANMTLHCFESSIFRHLDASHIRNLILDGLGMMPSHSRAILRSDLSEYR